MKKLAVICGSTNIGGAELQLIELIDSLEGMCEISLYLIGKPGDFPKLLEEKNIQFQRYNFSKISWIFDFMKLSSNLRGLNPNTVLGWLYRGEIIAGLGTFITRVDYVVGTSRNTNWPGASKLKLWILGFVRRHLVSASVANSEAAQSWHDSKGISSNHSFLIPNFIRRDYLDIEIQQKKVNSIPVIGMASRAVPHKGHSVLIQAAARLRESGIEVELDFIGYGIPDWGFLKDELRRLKMDAFTKLRAGALDLRQWYKDIDLYVSASEGWESDSNSILEAVLTGKPVIVSNVIKPITIAHNIPSFEVGDWINLSAEISNLLEKDPNQLFSELALRRTYLLESRDATVLNRRWVQALKL
jgi:glycosyltransferase involved in cell wall biosynthesis